jgi:pimeloyl-ACP methyl ester carboxylesterase
MMHADVTIPVELPDRLEVEIAATVHEPERAARSGVVMLAVPGGQYDRTYWHREVPGLSGYSFADDMLARGHTIVAIDNLGAGQSTRPSDPDSVTVERMGDAVAATARELRSGTVRGLGGQIDTPLFIGVGHSLGGQITALAQSAHRSFDALVILGSSFLGNANLATEQGRAQAEAALRALAGATWDSGYIRVPLTVLRPQFHLPDVPDALHAAEEEHATDLPRQAGVAAIDSAVMAPALAAIAVPVFLAFGTVDMSPEPAREPSLYPACPDMTLYRLEGSAHNHNAATTRQKLWDRVAAAVGAWRAVGVGSSDVS